MTRRQRPTQPTLPRLLHDATRRHGRTAGVIFLSLLTLFPFDLAAALQLPEIPEREETAPPTEAAPADSTEYLDVRALVRLPEEEEAEADSVLTVLVDENSPYGLDGKIRFNPSPTRAVWLSALFPGLGQIYNRRFWKLPIVAGGFMGLGYGVTWNNTQYKDYTQAYRDIMDSDPATNSYMNFFPPTTQESDLDVTWLSSTLRTRRDYYRRNRDLCIICCVALYLVCMIDAYVDASLAHFDISPDVSMDIAPALLMPASDRKPSLGLNWALTF